MLMVFRHFYPSDYISWLIFYLHLFTDTSNSVVRRGCELWLGSHMGRPLDNRVLCGLAILGWCVLSVCCRLFHRWLVSTYVMLIIIVWILRGDFRSERSQRRCFTLSYVVLVLCSTVLIPNSFQLCDAEMKCQLLGPVPDGFVDAFGSFFDQLGTTVRIDARPGRHPHAAGCVVMWILTPPLMLVEMFSGIIAPASSFTGADHVWKRP